MPELRLLRRYEVSSKLRFTAYAVSLILGIILFTLIEVAYGANFRDVLFKLFIKPITSYEDLKVTLRYFIPVGITSLGLLITYRAGIYSIGAEGQLVLGSIFTAWVAYSFTSLEKPISLIIALLAGALGGIVWALVPGLLKGLLNVNEVLTTLMLNFIAYSLTDYLIYGPWRSPKSFNFPLTDPLNESYVMPTYMGVSITGIAVLVSLVMIISILLRYTSIGYEIRAFGYNPAAAYVAGISLRRVALLTFILSGALAGLTGALQLTTVHYRLGPKPWSVSEGLGYTSIIAAWLSRLEPLAVLPTSILLAMLINGGLTIKASLGQPEGVVNLMNGIILITLVASEFIINYRVVIKLR